MSIDKYFSRVYHSRNYNCAHLVVEVWSDLFGEEMARLLRGFLCAPNERKTKLSDLKRGKWLKQIQDPCVVLMQNPKEVTHVGIYLRGKVLHIARGKGVQYQPLDVVTNGYKWVRFFTCR